jgi:hypothetical protein
MIKITREGVGNIVLLSWEPLGVLLDARFEEEGGMMSHCLDANLSLDEIRVVACGLPEVGLVEPSR